MREVVVAGTGIAPFGTMRCRTEDMVLDAGLAALDAAGCASPTSPRCTRHMPPPVTTGVRVMKEFGL